MDLSLNTVVPILQTDRLQLVALQAHHFEEFVQLYSDPDTMQFIGLGQALDRVGAWLHLSMLLGHWQLRGYGAWALEPRGGRELIGQVGLFHPAGWDEAELNWMICPALRGKGLAAEASLAVRDFAFDILELPSLISLIRPGNEPSRKVAMRMGALPEEIIDFLGAPMQVYRYLPLGDLDAL